MKLALVCPELAGHLNPMLTLGRALQGRGHSLTLVGSPMGAARAERAGVGFIPIGVKEYQSGAMQEGLAKLAQLRGFAALKLTGQLLKESVTIGLRDLPEAFRVAEVDGVLADQTSPAGGAVADVLGLPYVVICNALALHREASVPPATMAWPYRTNLFAKLRNQAGNALFAMVTRSLFASIKHYRKQHGVLKSNDPADDGLAQLAQQPAFFDFPRTRLPRHFHYSAPWHDHARDALDAAMSDSPVSLEFLTEADPRPIVYVSLGTLQNQIVDIFTQILSGLADLPVRVLVSLGRPGATWAGLVPANARVMPFVPQLQVLRQASIVVTHAGLNTALETLSHGLPMLCIPMTNDQPGVARRVEQLGAGSIIMPRRVTARRIRDAVKLLLDDARYRDRAKACQAQIAAAPGVEYAAAIVEQAIATRSRVYAPHSPR